MIKILTVDDEPEIIEIIQLALGAKFNIVGVHKAAEGLEKIKHESFDIVLTDLLMPILDGIEFIKELRKIDANMPVVCVSGVASEYTDKIKGLDVACMIQKPIDFKRLEEVILNFVDP